MEKKELRKREWNDSYMGGGNILFYPHEEIIRFVNKYVRKRTGYDSFKNVMNLSEQDWKSFKSLDLGCGCGRHVKFLDEFELEPYGCDLSEVAINLGKEWFRHIGNEKLVQRLFVANVAELPYDSDFFTICVSHGVLDSMPREIAMKGIVEAIRCLKSGGLMYFDLILDENNLSDKEEIQDYGLEKDTVQSYFTVTSIRNFIPKTADIVDFKIINWSDSGDVVFNKRAHVIIRKQ